MTDLILILAVASADTRPPLTSLDATRKYQQTLMLNVNANISASARRQIIRSNPPRDACDKWDGVLCDAGCVIQILHKSFHNLGNVSFQYLPSTVRTLDVRLCLQRFQVNTRLLPIDLVHLHLNANAIYGTLNLCTLPPRVTVFDIPFNRIQGPIRLLDLPSGLRILNLASNAIRQDAVLCGDLPDSIQQIFLIGGENHIQSYVAMDRASRRKMPKALVGVSRWRMR